MSERDRIVKDLTETIESYYPAIETGQIPEQAAECVWDEVVEPNLAALRAEITELREIVQSESDARLAESATIAALRAEIHGRAQVEADLRARAEAAEDDRDEHVRAHAFMVKQFETMRREKEHGWREAEKFEDQVDTLRARAEAAEAKITAALRLANNHEDRCGSSIHARGCNCRFGDIRAVLNRSAQVGEESGGNAEPSPPQPAKPGETPTHLTPDRLLRIITDTRDDHDRDDDTWTCSCGYDPQPDGDSLLTHQDRAILDALLNAIQADGDFEGHEDEVLAGYALAREEVAPDIGLTARGW